MRLLLISPTFFGYEKHIQQSFEGEGYIVDYVDERPSNSSWAKAFARVAPGIVRHRITSHFKDAARLLQANKYDGLVVIKGEVVPPWFLEEFERRNPTSPRIYYGYDSLEANPHAKKILGRFTHRFSFDRNDVATVSGLQYLPLFYIPAYAPSSRPREIDVAFIGTLHSDRYLLTQAIGAAAKPERRYLFYYIPAAWFFWLRKLASKHVRPVARSEVSTVPLGHERIAELIRSSRTVIDVQRPGQSGLTMRTFEVLASGAGLITTNEHIAYEPFFRSDRILIVPRNPAEIDRGTVEAFIRNQSPVASDIPDLDKYALGSWARELLSCVPKEGDY